MKSKEKEFIYIKLKDAKSHIEEAKLTFDELSSDKNVPFDIRDRVSRISSALEIDIDEIKKMKNFIKDHD